MISSLIIVMYTCIFLIHHLFITSHHLPLPTIISHHLPLPTIFTYFLNMAVAEFHLLPLLTTDIESSQLSCDIVTKWCNFIQTGNCCEVLLSTGHTSCDALITSERHSTAITQIAVKVFKF